MKFLVYRILRVDRYIAAQNSTAIFHRSPHGRGTLSTVVGLFMAASCTTQAQSIHSIINILIWTHIRSFKSNGDLRTILIYVG